MPNRRVKVGVPVLLMLGLWFALPAFAEEQPKPQRDASPALGSAQVDTWIAKLDDDRYQVREEATQHLFEAGEAALDPLLAVADAEKPEPSDRSVWILRRLSTAKDPALRRKALGHLAGLKKRPQVAAAARQQLADIEHQEAVDALEELGARIVPANEFVMQMGANYSNQLILDERWHGTDKDLARVRHLIGLRVVKIAGTNISLEGLQEFQHCPTLQILWLYGTKITADDLAKFRKLRPELTIDYRQGALLGVASSSEDALGPAFVSRVEPGSAAATAGVLQGDIIQKFDGEPIPNFKTLTQKVGAHHPGDEITLGIVRNGQPMDLKVKLGKWKTIDAE